MVFQIRFTMTRAVSGLSALAIFSAILPPLPFGSGADLRRRSLSERRGRVAKVLVIAANMDAHIVRIVIGRDRGEDRFRYRLSIFRRLRNRKIRSDSPRCAFRTAIDDLEIAGAADLQDHPHCVPAGSIAPFRKQMLLLKPLPPREPERCELFNFARISSPPVSRARKALASEMFSK
jgi:hypothetical protein